MARSASSEVVFGCFFLAMIASPNVSNPGLQMNMTDRITHFPGSDKLPGMPVLKPTVVRAVMAWKKETKSFISQMTDRRLEK